MATTAAAVDAAGEGEKILFFHPKLDLNRQKDYVGLSEALMNFTREFSPNRLCEAVQCEKTRYAYFEAEKDYWFVVVVNNPSLRQKKKDSKGKGNSEDVTFLEDELDDAVLQAILKRAYSLFKLFNGTIIEFVQRSSIVGLRTALGTFMEYFLPTVRFRQLRFFTDIHGFQFLPVDKTTFLTIQYLLTRVRQEFPMVQSFAMMFGSYLIWSGINQDDIFLLYTLQQGGSAMKRFYHYIAYNRPPTDPRYGPESPSPAAPESAASLPDPESGTFLTGPLSLLRGSPSPSTGEAQPRPPQGDPPPSASQAIGCPRVFLSKNERQFEQMPAESKDDVSAEERVSRLLVYQKRDITIFMLVQPPDAKQKDFDVSPEWHSRFASFIDSDLTKLAKMLSRQSGPSTEKEPFRFLYFNHLNLALKTSLNIKSQPLSMQTIQLIRGIHADFKKAFETDNKKQSTSEVCVRTEHNGWIVGRRADASQREFFVLIDNPTGNFADVQAEVDRLSQNYFYNIFIS